MATTPIYSVPLATRAAVFDELMKIAEEVKPKNSDKFKLWLKNSALVAAGAGAGTAASMVLDKLVGDHLGKTWQNVSPKTKARIIGPLLGASTMGAILAAKKLQEARKKAGE